MCDLTNEKWLPVVGFEGLYSVSDQGRIRREQAGCNTRPGKILKGMKYGRYIGVSLIKKDPSGKRPPTIIKRGIHAFVMEAFVGPRPISFHINHMNGVRSDNRKCNLEYVTMEYNIAHGRQFMKNGEDRPQAKLTNDDVVSIRHRYHVLGESIDSILEAFPRIARGTIYSVAGGLSWRHIEMPEPRRKLWKAQRKEYHPRRKGTQNGRALLTEKDVVAIRAEFDAGAQNVSALARKWGLRWSPMARLVHRKSWTHVP